MCSMASLLIPWTGLPLDPMSSDRDGRVIQTVHPYPSPTTSGSQYHTYQQALPEVALRVFLVEDTSICIFIFYVFFFL